MAATFSPDGTRLACGGNHPAFEVWESATMDEVAQWRAEDEAAAKRWAAWDQQAAAAKTALRPDWIKSWLILAPIPSGAGQTLAQQLRDEQVAGETQLHPRAEEPVRVGSREMRWKPARFENGVIDFSRFVGAGETLGVTAYAVCYVRSAQARPDLRLKVGSDDQSRVYLNGRLLHDYPFPGPMVKDQSTVVGVDLRAGVNVIVFKVINQRSVWSGTLRFVDDQDQPARGLEFSLSPD